MNILITGGCGFLGSNLAAHYLDCGEKVVVIHALFRRGSTENLGWLQSKAKSGQLAFAQLDLAEKEGLQQVFRRYGPFDFICHVGGQVAMTTSLTDPERDFRTNVVGTFNVLEAARSFSPEAFIAYSSTNKVYGDLEQMRYVETATRYTLPDHPEGFDESLPLDFTTPYGCSKGAADQYVRDWSRVYGLKTVVFRHSSIYGGRQFATFDQGWVGWFCQKALELFGSCFEYGKSGESFDFIPPNAPLLPIGPYSASKAAATLAAISLATERNWQLTVARPFHVFGEGESESRFWPSLRKAAIAGEDFPMTKGEQVRDFVPVAEVARQVLDACSNPPPPGQPEIRHIGTGNPQTLRAFAEDCWLQWKAQGKLVFGAKSYRQGEVMRFVPQVDHSIFSAAVA